MLKRVSLAWDAQRGFHVALPTYFIFAGTFLPLKKGVMHRDGPFPNVEPADVLQLNPTVIVSMPDEDCLNDQGQLCPLKISKKYAGHTVFDCADYVPPQLHEFQPIELDPPKDTTVWERVRQAMGFNSA